MSAPGTNELLKQDSLNKQKVDFHSLTTHPGGVHLEHRFVNLTNAQATIRTFLASPASISIVADDDGTGVTVFSTSDSPLEVDVTLTGF